MFLTSSHYWGCSKTGKDRVKIKDYLQGLWVVAYSKNNDEPADSFNKEKIPYHVQKMGVIYIHDKKIYFTHDRKKVSLSDLISFQMINLSGLHGDAILLPQLD